MLNQRLMRRLDGLCLNSSVSTDKVSLMAMDYLFVAIEHDV